MYWGVTMYVVHVHAVRQGRQVDPEEVTNPLPPTGTIMKIVVFQNFAKIQKITGFHGEMSNLNFFVFELSYL